MLPQQRNTLSIIEKAHANHCPVAVGGSDATFQPAIYQSADFLVHGEGEVFPESATRFFFKTSGATIEFTKNSKGAVTGLFFTQIGRSQAKKVE